MRLAVISDIHGNQDALRQVLRDIERSDVDAVFCLGDNIGYGPEPDQVVSLLEDYPIPSIMGNHELAIREPAYLMGFNPLARFSIEMTLELLSEKSIHFIGRLKSNQTRFGCRFVHGFPPDSVTTYLHDVPQYRLKSVLTAMEEKICFVGHTHLLAIIGFDGRQVSRQYLAPGVVKLEKRQKYIINAGSVGQPRDADNRAKYVIWDTVAYTLDARFIAYDVSAVYHKILNTGLPREHAERLL